MWKAKAPNGTLRCNLDGGPGRPCSSRITYNALRPGAHQFLVHTVGRTATRTAAWTILRRGAPGGTSAPKHGSTPTSTTTGTKGTTGTTGTPTGTGTNPPPTAPGGSTPGGPITGPNSFGSDIFGVATGSTLQNDSPSDLANDLNLDANAGAGWIRIDINWAQIQAQGPNSYNWWAIDNAVESAESRGMSVLGTIVFTPNWSRPAGTDATYVASAAQFAAFAAVAAQHYSALGVQDFEIWNEPNQIGGWTPKPDVGAYTTLLKDSYTAIKNVDPSATVISGGLSPAASDGTNIAPVDFLRGIYADGGQGSFDAVGMHPYTNPDLPGAPDAWSAWYQMYGTPTSLRSLMIANGDGAKKIWGTEFGAPTSGASGVSSTFQAETVARGYELWSTYSWAGPLFFYEGRDNGNDAGNAYDNYGFATTGFSLKPSFYSYQTAARTV
jgi:hypothetical protein